jgi:hypothetical protein
MTRSPLPPELFYAVVFTAHGSAVAESAFGTLPQAEEWGARFRDDHLVVIQRYAPDRRWKPRRVIPAPLALPARR